MYARFSQHVQPKLVYDTANTPLKDRDRDTHLRNLAVQWLRTHTHTQCNMVRHSIATLPLNLRP